MQLKQQRKKYDLTISWRLLTNPTNGMLEMHKLEERRATSGTKIQLQWPDNTRHGGNFDPSMTLQQMLDWYRNQPEWFVLSKR